MLIVLRRMNCVRSAKRSSSSYYDVMEVYIVSAPARLNFL
jgi:hypothetical protein